MPQSHFQLSFTGRQAMAFFAVCLAALGLAFFLGLMTGLSGRPAESPAAGPAPEAALPVPTVVASSAADGAGAPAPAQAEALPIESTTPPAVLQAFEDRGSEPTAPPPTAKRPASVATPAPAPSGLWIQVASVADRREADALAARLSRGGYHVQVAAAEGAKGRVFRVRVGPYRSEDEAARASAKLRGQERIRETWIVRDGH